MKAIRHVIENLRAFLRGFVGATELGPDPRATLCEHGQRRGRCC